MRGVAPKWASIDPARLVAVGGPRSQAGRGDRDETREFAKRGKDLCVSHRLGPLYPGVRLPRSVQNLTVFTDLGVQGPKLRGIMIRAGAAGSGIPGASGECPRPRGVGGC